MFGLKLPLVYIRLYGEGKRAVISNLKYIRTPSSRSYIVFALDVNFVHVKLSHMR